MIKYRCKKCGIDVDTSECPVCNERADSISNIYWCDSCQIPSYTSVCGLCSSDIRRLATDIRPVFPEERLLVELILDKPLAFKNDSVWHSGQRYYVNGKPILLPIKLYTNIDLNKVINGLKEYQPDNTPQMFNAYIERFVQANRTRYEEIVSEACSAIRDSSAGYSKDEMFVSFSGGKDSTVTSDIVMRAFGDPSILHIFGDTTLEFPETMDYINRFRSTNRKTPMLTARNNDKNFYEMCEIVGPPSRVMRWCCTIFKTGAITKRIQSTFGNSKSLLTFYGIRRSESTSRGKYERDTVSPKIAKQRVMSPIIDWIDFDIWLYLLTTNIDFNYAYRLGYSRVGCWCCPNNGEWSQFLAKIYMSEEYSKFRLQLIAFASEIGKPDPEEYIDGGWWKARQGGNGLELSKSVFVEFKPCAVSDNTFNYELNKPISDELYELFKPFGYLNYDMGNKRLGEVYVVNKAGETLLKLQGRKNSNTLKVTIEKLPLLGAKSLRDAEMKIKCQLTKYQMCLGCLACEGVCKYSAIALKGANGNAIRYVIDDKKCVRCGECVNHFDGGCYMRKVLMTKRGG